MQITKENEYICSEAEIERDREKKSQITDSIEWERVRNLVLNLNT